MRIRTPYSEQSEWPAVAARWLFTRERRLPAQTDEIVTAFRDGVVTARSNRRTEGFTNAIQEIGYQGVRSGDLVLHSMDGFAGAIGVSDSNGKSSPVVHCYQPAADVDARFYAYLLRDLAVRGFITSLAKGIRERSTSFDADSFRSLLLPVPPPKVQRAIADYLDAETAHIDALIEKKRRMVELVKERARSLVSVLTDYPKRVSVRHVTSLCTSGPRGWAEMVGETGRPFIRSANLRHESIDLKVENVVFIEPPGTREAKRSAVRTGDVLVGITGANTGWVGCVGADLDGGFVSQHVAILRPRDVDPAWLAYSIFSSDAQNQLLAGQYGGTKQQLGLDDLLSLSIGRPDLSEQRRRTIHLAHALEAGERLIERLERQIALLVERRQALITAAVTGQLDIPGVAA